MATFATIVTKSGEVYTDYLVLENDDDIIAWGSIRRDALSDAIAHCVTCILREPDENESKDGYLQLYESARKYTTDGMAILGAYKATDFLNWDAVSQEELNGQFREMFKSIDRGERLCVNKSGGYFPIKSEKIDRLDYQVTADEESIREFVKSGLIPTKVDKERYFCYMGKGKILADKIYNHDLMLRYNGHKEDEGYKFIYYPEKCHEHKHYCEFGIRGLRLSVVYDQAEEPFELKKSDIDAIERYINDEFAHSI